MHNVSYESSSYSLCFSNFNYFQSTSKQFYFMNEFLITIKGSRMTTELNGERVIDTPDLPELPKTGPIGLQHHGDPVQFRQLWVKSLD